jgi:hypothetical protein
MSEQKTDTIEEDLKNVQGQTQELEIARSETVVRQVKDESCWSVACCNRTINKMCCKLYKDRDDIESMLEGIDLPEIQKQHIQSRYINILENFKKRTRKFSLMFYIGHFVITVGSLFVPALLSIQNASSTVSFANGFTIPVYIITFVVSLLVTIFNGILTLFKIDKKFYFLNTITEKLRSEGWQFLGLTGRYSGRLNNVTPTHTNQFLYFSHEIEKIKMSQVQEEFYKTDDAISKEGVRSNTGVVSDLFPLSPAKPIDPSTVPHQDVKNALNSIVAKTESIIPKRLDSMINNSGLPDSVKDTMHSIVNADNIPKKLDSMINGSGLPDSVKDALHSIVTKVEDVPKRLESMIDTVSDIPVFNDVHLIDIDPKNTVIIPTETVAMVDVSETLNAINATNATAVVSPRTYLDVAKTHVNNM